MRTTSSTRVAEEARIADRTIDKLSDRCACDFIPEYAQPFTLMVVADLLGVPDEDRDEIRTRLTARNRPMAKFRASLVPEGGRADLSHKPLEFLYEQFTRYIEDRRLIPVFVEEQLLIESPLEGAFRLARVPTTVGGIDLPAGTTVFLMPDAANRDPTYMLRGLEPLHLELTPGA